MSHDIVPQVDVGTLSIRGLATFTPLLSALSADDVAPLTMVQLENLGSPFHINGPYALMIPDLLRRCSSVRMDRIGVMIGWRKGDTASFLAQSAGGQAVALLCFCLANTCKHQDVGSVLSDLSELILPKSLAISSISQLTTVADLLAAKLQVIGFGNLLAAQVVKIQDVYHHLDKRLPSDFFDFMTRESTVELYHALSRLSSQDDIVLRISGVHAMGHIMIVVLIMFPDNVRITTDNLVVREGPSPSVFLDINTSTSEISPTMIQVEERLKISCTNPILVEVIPKEYDHSVVPYSFTWNHHITDALQIALASVGAGFSDALVEACCNLVLSLLQPMRMRAASLNEARLPLNGLPDLLGPNFVQRCYHVCQTVFGMTPTTHQCNIQSAYGHLINVVNSLAGPASHCTCSGIGACNLKEGWEHILKKPQAKSVRQCLHRTLWRNIFSAVNRCYSILLIDANPQATTIFDITETEWWTCRLPEVQNIGSPNSTPSLEFRFWDCSGMNKWVMAVNNMSRRTNASGTILAFCNGGSTLYPTSLNDLQIDIDKGFRYRLDEGQLHVKGRHYNQLISAHTRPRQKASKQLVESKSLIRPSCSGEHSHISFTIRESLEALELRTTAIVQGHSIQLDLHSILTSSMGLNDAPECSHSQRAKLSAELHADVWTTSIAAPQAKHKKIAIVQTKDNPTAQLLACAPSGSGMLLQRKSCLDCAVAYAKLHNLSQIIVAS